MREHLISLYNTRIWRTIWHCLVLVHRVICSCRCLWHWYCLTLVHPKATVWTESNWDKIGSKWWVAWLFACMKTFSSGFFVIRQWLQTLKHNLGNVKSSINFKEVYLDGEIKPITKMSEGSCFTPDWIFLLNFSWWKACFKKMSYPVQSLESMSNKQKFKCK